MCVISVDTPQKDKESNDLIAIQAWAVIGADRYLIDARKDHMNFNQAKRAVKEMSTHVRKLFPQARRTALPGSRCSFRRRECRDDS